VQENFFDLGGHSLLATQVMSRLRSVLRAELPVRVLFEAPTVSELAQRVEAALRGGAGAEVPPLVRVERSGELPLSFAQERLWVIQRLDPQSSAYNMPVALRLSGVLDVVALEAALKVLVERHESLRTVLPSVGDMPVQRILPADSFSLAIEDLSALPEGERRRTAREFVRGEARQPFDLEEGPLFRAFLLRLGAEEHVLLLSMHHVISDGWSTGVLFRELSALYGAFGRGEPSPLPAPKLQYADFSVWQRSWLRGEELERQLSYWRDRLAGAPAVLELPTDRPRPAVRTDGGADVHFSVRGETYAALRTVSRREGATPFMTLLAVWQLLLSKYSGQEDVVVGTPIAGRREESLEGLVGFFVNTLALRTDLSGDPTFRDLLARVREAAVGAYAFQDLPFERLVEEMAPERSLSHTPLFQVAFTFQDAAGGAPELPGLAVESLQAGEGTSKFDLTLTLSGMDGGLGGALSYSTDLFDPPTARRIVGHFAALLEEVAAAPGGRLSDLGLLPEAERRQVVEEWSGGRGAVPYECVHRTFSEQARRTPDAAAVTWRGESLTYAELEGRASALAHFLLRRGVGRGARVGLCVERTPAMLVAMLGVLKTGAAYVPLDPAYPRERLAFMLGEIAAPVVLSQASLAGELPDAGGEIVLLDRDWSRIAQESPTDPAVEVGPEDVFYVTYTSGSTGTPKGTEVPHRAVPGFFRGITHAEYGPDEVLLQHSSVSWDAGLLEIWPALAVGGRCVLYPGGRAELDGLAEVVAREGVTTLWFPSAFFNLLVDTRPEALAGVRQVLVGGEAVSPEHLHRARRLYPALRLVNGYGPSECTVFTTCHVLPESYGGGPVPIGRPVGDRRAYVLDRFLAPLPVGVPGELFVGGPAVPHGYLARPELTAASLVPDPFSTEPGARLYRTGDRVRWLPDGMLEFLGRMDQQVKVRGFRVELEEVEAVLVQHSDVSEAVAVVREDAPGDRRLVAYVVPRGPEACSPSALRRWMQERLPEYMVPSAVVPLEALPLTANRKVDRRALPAPGRDAADAAGHAVPRTPTGEVLAALFAALLRVERVGARDDFFALGGNSLLATQLASRVESTFRVHLPVRAVFEAPTPAGLAERVDDAARAGEGRPLPPLVRAQRGGDLPLSFAQERLWILHRMDPASIAYNMPFVLRLRGRLDPAALGRAVETLVERHESLRTILPTSGDGPVQRVLPAGAVPVPLHDLSHLGAGERREAALGLARELAWQPFDLAAGPLFHATLIREAEEDHLLVLGIHHVVSDGWSMGVLFRELGALYAAFADGAPDPLEPLPLQYADYAVWQRSWLEGEVLERQVGYWRGRLRGAPTATDLPTDRPRRGVQGTRGARHLFAVPGEVRDGLAALARREGATLFMTALAAWKLLLSRCSGEEDLVVGTPIAGRASEVLEGLVGFFVNTLALRTDLSRDPSFRELLGRMRETTLGAYAHQDLPFEKLVDEIGAVRDVSHSPVFQVMFTLANLPRGGRQLGPLSMEQLELESGTVKFDLAASLVETRAGLAGSLEYRTDLFDAATVERLAARFVALLQAVADAPDARGSSLPLMGEEEREQVVHRWNDTRMEHPGVLVHRRFSEWAGRNPDAPALHFEGTTLGYGELDRWSNAIARRLHREGVGPEVRVGILAHRGPALVAGVLGILKAGGAYVPLDPWHPADRLAYMLSDSRAPLVLVDPGAVAALPATGARVLPLERVVDEESAEAPECHAFPESLAYVIYTSGSTGQPKGVLVEHRGIANLAHHCTARLGMGPADTTLSVASISFDVWVLEVLVPLATGGAVRMVPRERVVDLPRLVEEVARSTAIFLVPALMREVIPAVRLAHPGGLPGMRITSTGGDSVPRELREEQLEVFPAAGIHVLYGPTETSVSCAAHRVGVAPEERNLIGSPMVNVALYVVDAAGEPVPPGVAGELLIGGAGVGRGYLDRPDLTADRFVPDPFSGLAGARLYRSGDRARWTADGEIDFLGRMDGQVKIRGFRVEPAEIEAVLKRHPAVRDAVVVVREDTPGDRRLVAYLLAGPGAAAPPAGELRHLARETLPEYMVPAAFVELDQLPLTPSGKVDRKALPAPAAGGDGAAAPDGPATAEEERIAAVWESVLGTRAGVNDSFFDVGGNSLLLVQVAAKLEEALGHPVPIMDLFQHTTVRALARHLSGAAADAPAESEGRTEKLSRGKERLRGLRRRQGSPR